METPLKYSKPQLNCLSKPRLGLVCSPQGSTAGTGDPDSCIPGGNFTGGDCGTGDAAAETCGNGTIASIDDFGTGCTTGNYAFRKCLTHGNTNDGDCDTNGGTPAAWGSTEFTCIDGPAPTDTGACVDGGSCAFGPSAT